MKSVFPIFFILLNLFFILYLPRKLSIWVRLALPIYRWAVLFMDVQQICPDLPICTHPVIATIRRIS